MYVITALLFTGLFGCATSGDAVRVTTVSAGEFEGLAENEIARLAAIKKKKDAQSNHRDLNHVIQATPNYTVTEYLQPYPRANATAQDYRVC